MRIHSVGDDGISDPLADHDRYHDRHNVGQSSSQLKHDHHKRHCRAGEGEAREHGCQNG